MPLAAAISAICSTGKMVPVSLLAHITETMATRSFNRERYSSMSMRPLLVHLQLVDDVAFLFQPFTQRQYGRMLDDGGDHRVAVRLRLQRRQDGGRVGLGAAGGEDDFRVMLGAEQRLHLTPGPGFRALPTSLPKA